MRNRLIRLSARRIIAAFTRKSLVSWLNRILYWMFPFRYRTFFLSTRACKCNTRDREGSHSYGNGSYLNKPDTLPFASSNAITRITLMPLPHSISFFSLNCREIWVHTCSILHRFVTHWSSTHGWYIPSVMQFRRITIMLTLSNHVSLC